MAKTRTPKDDENKFIQDKVQKQYEDVFLEQNSPPSHLSLRQVEALKARVADLEAELEARGTKSQNEAASEPNPMSLNVKSGMPNASATEKQAHEQAAHSAENNALSDSQRRRNMGLFSGFLAAMGSLGSIFYLVIYLQTGVWQILAEAGFIILALGALMGIARPLIKRGKFPEASTWIMVSMSIAFASPELVWENATAQLLVTGILLLFVIGTTYPPQPLTWFVLPILYIAYMFVVNVIEPLPLFDINQSPAVQLFTSSVTVVMGVWVLWQLTRLIIRYSREASASVSGNIQLTSGQNQLLKFNQSPFWRAMTRLLVEPDQTVVGIESRRQAQLLTTLLVILVPAYLLGQLIQSTGQFGPNEFIGALNAIFLFGAYGLSRTRRYQTGAILTVLTLTAAIYENVLLSTTAYTPSGVLSGILWLTLPLFLSSFILPLRSMFVYLLGNSIAMIALTLMPRFPASVIVSPVLMVIIANILLMIGRRFREQVEQENQTVLITKNQEIEAKENISQSLSRNLLLASEISQRLSQVRDLTSMLNETAEIIRADFDLYYVQVYLTTPNQTALFLQAGTGTVGAELVRRSHRLLLNANSINGRAATEKHAIVVPETAVSSLFRSNPLLPDTRSEMAIPLIVGGKVVGVLDVQSEQPGALNETNLPAFEALAGQLAIAIENAALLAQTEEARTEVETQVRQLTQQGWQEFLDAIDRGQKIGYAFEQSTIVRLQPEALAAKDGAFSIPITVTGTQIGEIRLPSEQDHAWTNNELELVKATSTQLAQHVENLRLLTQAKQYRAEAEQAVQRLTHEGWDNFMQTHTELEPGYMFDLTEVKPLAEKNNDPFDYAIKHPITVGDQTIGELAVDTLNQSDEASEVIAAVAEQLSGHIENLRLSELNERHAQREKTLRQITSALRSSNNPATIMRTAVRELGSIMGRKAVVQLVSPQQARQAESATSNENNTSSPAHQS